MKILIISSIILACIYPCELVSQRITFESFWNLNRLNINQLSDYTRGYSTNPNISFGIGFMLKEKRLTLEAGRQVNTLIEKTKEEPTSAWFVTREIKTRTQNYLAFSVGGQVFKQRRLGINYLAGIQLNKSVKTCLLKETVSKGNKEFVFYDNQLNTNYCVKQEMVLNFRFLKEAAAVLRGGLLFNLIPYDEENAQNIILYDFRWASYVSIGLQYGISLNRKRKT